jgi:hypothetical protein
MSINNNTRNITTENFMAGQSSQLQPPTSTRRPLNAVPDELIHDQKLLIILLHGRVCLRRRSENVNHICRSIHCQAIQDKLNHMLGCTLGERCRESECSRLGYLSRHWDSCQFVNCATCVPIRKRIQQSANRATQQQPIGKILH